MASWRVLVPAAAIVAATVAVAIELLVEGPFLWHFSHGGALQGAAEICALAGVLYLVATRAARSRWRLAWWLLPMAVYLRRHHVDLPALLALGYLEFLLAAGFLLGRWMRLADAQEVLQGWLARLLVGLVAWSCVLWGLQLAGAGGAAIAWLALASAAVPVFLLARQRPLSVVMASHAFDGGRAWALLCACSAALLCGLFARTNLYEEHDALWYGFRPADVLVGGTSVFDSLGLVSPVHYFPKFYEVLLLPLSAVGDFSFVGGFTILLAGLTAVLAHRLLRSSGVPRLPSHLAALALLTTPALANPALGPKPDVLAALAVLAMLYSLRQLLRRDGGPQQFLLLTCWAAVAALSKLNLLPYVAVLGATGSIAALRNARWTEFEPRSLLLPSLAAAVFVAVTARTFVLTGVPTVAPEQLVDLWRALGMELQLPAGTLDWIHPQDWRDVPALVVDWLFRPARLPHIVVSWPGHLWFVLPLAVALATLDRRAPPQQATWPEWLVVATGTVLLLGVSYHYRGSDGNYFIAPVAAAVVLAARFAWRRLGTALLHPVLVTAIAAGIAFQAYYAFVSAGWGTPGTRRLDVDFTRSVWDTPATRSRQLHAAGLGNIGAYLAATTRSWRVVGEAPEPQAFWLPARYESIDALRWSRPELLEDPQSFAMYLHCFGIDAAIVRRAPDSLLGPLLRPVLQDRSDKAMARDDAFALVDLQGVEPAAPCPHGWRLSGGSPSG